MGDDIKAELAVMRAELKWLTDLQAMRDVLQRYARWLDRHDVELERSAFWPEAQINYGSYSGLRDDFVEWGNQGHENLTAHHEQHITNQTVEIDGDTAHVESYVIFFLREKDEQHTLIGGARYIDRMERRSGEWRILVREFLPDIMIRANSVYEEWFHKTPGRSYVRGQWNRSDLSYLRPLEPRPGPSTGQDQTNWSERLNPPD